ncbi:hypothetical protein jhhlp_000540 [Lomentospora prolificans]|uniref:Histone-lysine N-methyltransferase ASH1L n=1 Tax=Lomentospora prolificans TaxID=41688 RepID=A0A2N3NL63_9PEZI|nr:hypothetical protein jhhlp_000540 [Lomentospora prolificans]
MSLATESSISAAPSELPAAPLLEVVLGGPVDLACSSSTASCASSAIDSTSSTPPTSISDACSQSSDAPKLENINVAVDTPPPPELHASDSNQDATLQSTPTTSSRPRRTRGVPTYNLTQLSGTSAHGKRRANGDIVAEKRRRTISADTLVATQKKELNDHLAVAKDSNGLLRAGIDALDLQWSISQLDTPPSHRQSKKDEATNRRASARLAGDNATTVVASQISSLTKRGKQTVETAVSTMSRELKRLQDTKEFAHIDDQPVVHTVWSNGKLVNLKKSRRESAKQKAKSSEAATKQSPAPVEEEESTVEAPAPAKKRRVKKYLEKGLYAGQPTPNDYTIGLTTAEKKRMAQIPELKALPKPNKVLPLPVYNGLRLLIKGRDFKLPFDVCNPLPPGQPKPDEWRKMTKNRFIGDSKEYWRKTPHINDFQSKCVCKPEDGCGESCQNRIMLYECDSTNCNVGKEYCTNRAFAHLAERRAAGGKYRIGVEVIKTADRGYGVRSNRCFEPNQIIMEYTGEIITEEECERRMNEVYKNNACYYLMSFDQNMIIDATTGSIARFVNHSCNPNCRMIKWIVGGNPRMALFAGDRPIMTGEELTYDYKFDPFSAKNVQSCLCGEHNCRGVLGPKPKEKPKEAKTEVKGKGGAKSLKDTVKAGKRKLKELVGDEDNKGSVKKRKVGNATGVKRSLSSASLKAAKGAAAVVKRSVSAVSLKAKSSLGSLNAKGRSPASKAQSKTKAPAIKAQQNKSKASGKGTPLSASKRRNTLVKQPPLKSASADPLKKTRTGRVIKAYAKAQQTPSPAKRQGKGSSSCKATSTIVAATSKDEASPGFRSSPVSKSGRIRKLTEKAASPRAAMELSRAARVRLVQPDE